MTKMTFALYFGNRGFFPGSLIASARSELKQVVEGLGHETLIMGEEETRFGAVETVEEGLRYAAFLKQHRGEYDGVILSLPNFGDENGAIAALRDCGVPILIQAYPDEAGKMDFESRRDAFCGKFSIMDVFYQYNLPYTIFKPHTATPDSEAFRRQLVQFAAVCRVVKGMKRLTVGGIGARTTAFKTVRYDETTLQRYGITTEALDLSELFSRVRDMKVGTSAYGEKADRLKNYTNFTCVPEGKFETLVKVSVALDDIIQDYRLDCLALRCWNEMETELGVSPCVLLSELNDRGFVAACEMDICNAVAMQALSFASGKASACLDWNNNYGEEPDKCILFHCGPVAGSMMTGKGTVTDHKMFAKSFGQGCGWGCNEGRIAAAPLTYASAKTDSGKLVFYTGEGRFTGEPIEDGFFGCGGVAEIQGLQDKLLSIGRKGFRHHVSVTMDHVDAAVREAFGTYLGYEMEQF